MVACKHTIHLLQPDFNIQSYLWPAEGLGAKSVLEVLAALPGGQGPFSSHVPCSLFPSDKGDMHTQLKSHSHRQWGKDAPVPSVSSWHPKTGSSVASESAWGQVLPVLLRPACNISPFPRTSHLKGSALRRARWILHFTEMMVKSYWSNRIKEPICYYLNQAPDYYGEKN